MRRTRWVLALLVAALAGCGGDAADSTGARKGAAPPTPEYPVAYAVARDDLDELARKPLPEAVEGAKVVASSSWDGYTLAVLSEWLAEHGVDLDRPSLPAAGRLGEAWEVPVFVITAEHARRYGRKLARLRPDRAELRTYFEAFSEESRPSAGKAMAEYLEIVRTAMAAAKGDRTVVMPLED